MTQEEAKARFTRYLKSNFIKFHEDTENGAARYRMEYNDYRFCPENKLESCIWFLPDNMEVRVYYSASGAELCKESKHIPELMRLLNCINATVWPMSSDRKGGTLYKPHILYLPRIYMEEDGMPAVNLALPINYSFYEAAPLETEDFITACCPDLMNMLAFAIFGVLLGEVNLEQAMAYVRANMFGEGM